MPENDLRSFECEFSYQDEQEVTHTTKYDFSNLELAQEETLQESLYKMAAHSYIM